MDVLDVSTQDGPTVITPRVSFLPPFPHAGTEHACQILSVDCESATQEEIRSACRKLSREWHPDKHKEEEQKKIAQEKFIEIQDACQKLDEKRRRAKGRSQG